MTIDPLAPHHANLVHDLLRQGFFEVEKSHWRGDIDVDGTQHSVQILTSPGTGYPAHPPAVRLLADRPPTWHQNADGSLCLYPNADPGPFPWLKPGDLIERTRNWIVQAGAGWPDEDPPDLDLHRYWHPSDRWDLLMHSRLEDAPDLSWLRLDRLQRDPRVLCQSGWQTPPRRRPASHQRLYALVVDVGEPEQPPRTWGDLAALLAHRATVEELVHQGRADVVLVKFARKGVPGVLGLDVRSAAGKIRGWSVECAEDSPAVRDLRRGPARQGLHASHVAIVGVGSVGSSIADGLARAGVGRFTLVDHERLRPGNLTRHAAPAHFVGSPKALSMEASLRAAGATNVVSRLERVTSFTVAQELLNQHDLVVDTTGSTVVATLLREAARTVGKDVVVAYLANEGRSLVVDVVPRHPESRPTYMTPTAPDAVEAGCGEPVSRTPPYAVAEVAAMACWSAVKLLTTGTAEPQLRERP